MDLVHHLVDKNRLEECISVLLNILACDRNFKERSANKKLMEIFKTLGATNEKVKEGKKNLAKILL
jgi:thioredoxin-like negative regulator of GroEL